MREQKRLSKESLIADDGELWIEWPVESSDVLALSFNKRKRDDDENDSEPDPLMLCFFFWSITLGYPLALYGFIYGVNAVLLRGGSPVSVMGTAFLGLIMGFVATGRYWEKQRYISYGLLVGIAVAMLLMFYYVSVSLVVSSLNHGSL